MNDILDLIQQRRLQLLVHSCIYYHFNQNIISDTKWDEWAKELVELQKQYPKESKTVIWYETFKDWDASTGAFLPITDEWVIKKAQYVMSLFHCSSKPIPKNVKPKKVVKKAVKQGNTRKLF